MSDHDSLHVLPLSMIPLRVKALQKTRLIKNARLEGAVELYSGGATGRGLVSPKALERVFDFSGDRAIDLEIVKKLAVLPSYDVYSLRVGLRELNIPIDDVESLKLSDEMAQSLLAHMTAFTRPLILKIYGDANMTTGSFRDVLTLFTDPNADVARNNLRELAKSLDIQLMQIPKFLEDYADVYLSLSFYQKCHDDSRADLEDFLSDMYELAHSPGLAHHAAATRDIESVASKIRGLHRNVAHVVELFRVRTEGMWQDISPERYRRVSQMVATHQEKIGANLCALSVKLDAWKQKAPASWSSDVTEKVSFVTREIGYGLQGLSTLQLQDL